MGPILFPIKQQQQQNASPYPQLVLLKCGHSGLEGMLEYALMKKFQPGCSHLPAVPNLASCLLPVCWALSSQGQEAPVPPSCSSGGTWGKEQGTVQGLKLSEVGVI